MYPQDNSVLIHFDGWKGYDYWTEANSNNVHPLGWFKEIGIKKEKYTAHLNPPKFLGKY